MIKVSLTTEEDIKKAVLDAKEIFRGERDLEKNAIASLASGRVYTLTDDDGNIGCICGVSPVWAGVMDVWTIITTKIELLPLSYVRCILRLLENWMIDYQVHRVGMTARTDDKAVHKWARVLGFKEEGILRKYGPDGSDYTIYGRVS